MQPRPARHIVFVVGTLLAWATACDLSFDLPVPVGKTAAGVGGAGGQGGGEAACPALQARCDGACLDLRFDPSHCGACGNACDADEVCSEGKCALKCAGGTTKCEVDGKNRCVDTALDASHCGGCGDACTGDEVCSIGKCDDDCNGGTALCEVGGKPGCFDLKKDEAHCGACDSTCGADETCVGGACKVVCVAGSTVCAVAKELGGAGGAGGGAPPGLVDTCVDLQNDPKHCGGCGNACAQGKVCQQGACLVDCLGGSTKCDVGGVDLCIDVQNDPSHCGGCGNACAQGKVCQQGACVVDCLGGSTKCDVGGVDVCVDTTTDVAHCGGCNTECAAANASNFCSSGSCDYKCDAGYDDCNVDATDGCEVDLQTDSSNCGSCGNACPGGAACIDGECSTAFYFWGDFATDTVQQFALLTFPGASVDAPPSSLFGLTAIDETYAIEESPDGSKVAIALRGDGAPPVVIVIDDQGFDVVADFTGQANAAGTTELQNLRWSPDGNWLSFVVDSEANNQKLLYAAPADGSATAPKKLSPTGSTAQMVEPDAVAWIDNARIAFVGDLITDNIGNLFLVDATAATPSPAPVFDQTPLTTTQDVRGPVALGGDGKIYFLSAHVSSSSPQVYRCDLDGTNVSTVAEALVGGGARPILKFKLSPDGGSIAVTSDELGDGVAQVYVAKLGDAAPVKRTVFQKPATGTTFGVLTGTQTFEWSPDGSRIALVGDWVVDPMVDVDNDYALFLVPTSGDPGATRIFKVPAPAMNYDVDGVVWSHDGTRLLVKADIVVNNDTELYSTTDLTTADQDPVAARVVDVPAGGDVTGMSSSRSLQ